jgi:hypothetical protein
LARFRSLADAGGGDLGQSLHPGELQGLSPKPAGSPYFLKAAIDFLAFFTIFEAS